MWRTALDCTIFSFFKELDASSENNIFTEHVANDKKVYLQLARF